MAQGDARLRSEHIHYRFGRIILTRNPSLWIKQRARELLGNLLADMCLTPTRRAKVAIGPEKPEDRFEASQQALSVIVAVETVVAAIEDYRHLRKGRHLQSRIAAS